MSELTMLRLMFALPYLSLGVVIAWLGLRGERLRPTSFILAVWVALTWPFWVVTWPFWVVTWLLCRLDGRT